MHKNPVLLKHTLQDNRKRCTFYQGLLLMCFTPQGLIIEITSMINPCGVKCISGRSLGEGTVLSVV